MYASMLLRMTATTWPSGCGAHENRRGRTREGEQRRRAGNRCFLVESAGETLLITLRSSRWTPGAISSKALFVGDCRCLSMDADKFASVEANFIYYVVEEPWYDVWRAPSHEAAPAPVMVAGCQRETGTRAAAPSP